MSRRKPGRPPKVKPSVQYERLGITQQPSREGLILEIQHESPILWKKLLNLFPAYHSAGMICDFAPDSFRFVGTNDTGIDLGIGLGIGPVHADANADAKAKGGAKSKQGYVKLQAEWFGCKMIRYFAQTQQFALDTHLLSAVTSSIDKNTNMIYWWNHSAASIIVTEIDESQSHCTVQNNPLPNPNPNPNSLSAPELKGDADLDTANYIAGIKYSIPALKRLLNEAAACKCNSISFSRDGQESRGTFNIRTVGAALHSQTIVPQNASIAWRNGDMPFESSIDAKSLQPITSANLSEAVEVWFAPGDQWLILSEPGPFVLKLVLRKSP